MMAIGVDMEITVISPHSLKRQQQIYQQNFDFI